MILPVDSNGFISPTISLIFLSDWLDELGK
jgi:hypothetical protein